MPDLTTLVAVKQWDASISASNTNADALLSSLISATSADFLREVGRPDLLATDYTEQRVGDGSCRMVMRHGSINTVGSVTVAGSPLPGGTFGVDTTLDPERRYIVYLTGGQTFTDGAAVAVTYNAGYATPPADIAQAVVEWVVLRFKKKGLTGQTQVRNSEGDRADVDPAAIPPNTQRIIDLYKRKWPGYGRLPESAAGGGAAGLSQTVRLDPARRGRR